MGGRHAIDRYADSRYLIFRDRSDAGRQLAERLAAEFSGTDCLVLALPRGGVPVAYEIALALKLPLDVLIVRKLGAPFQHELAIGAIGPHGVIVLNERLVEQLGLDPSVVEEIREAEQAELERRERTYRGKDAEPLRVSGRTVIVVDDGIATGSTMFAAVKSLRQLGPKKIVVAVPTSSRDAYLELQQLADEVIALTTPEPYIAVGSWYEQFCQTSDDDVKRILASETV